MSLPAGIFASTTPPEAEPEPAIPSQNEEDLVDYDGDEDWVDTLVDEDSDDDLAPSIIELEQPQVDENGLIRIGPQPVPAHTHDIRSAPSGVVHVRLWKKMRENGRASDSKVPGVNSDIVAKGCEKLLKELEATMV